MTSKFTNIIFFIVLPSLIANCSSFGEGPRSKFFPNHNSWFQDITKGKDNIKSAVSSKVPDVPVIDSSENSHLENFLVDYICQPVAKVVYPVYDTVTGNHLLIKDTIKSHVTKPVENLAESFTTAVKPNLMNQFHKLVPAWFSKEKLTVPFKKTIGNLVPSTIGRKIASQIMHPLEHLNIKNPFSGYFKNVFQFRNPFAGFPKNFFGHLSLSPLKTVQKVVSHLMTSNLLSNVRSKIAQTLQFFQIKNPLAGYSMNFFNQLIVNPLKNIKMILGHLVPSSLVKLGMDKVINLGFFACGVVAVVLAMQLYRYMKYLAGEYEMFEDFYFAQNNEDSTKDKAVIQLQDSEKPPSDIAETIKPDEDDEKDLIDEKETPADTKTSSTQKETPVDTKTSSAQTIKKDEKTSSTQTLETTGQSSESQADQKDSKDQEVQTDIPQEPSNLLSSSSSTASTRNNKLHPPAITPNM